jgi:hypothetical protein
VTQEFIRQKSKFSRTAILSAPEMVGKFAHLNGQGIEVVAGSLLDEKVYRVGRPKMFLLDLPFGYCSRIAAVVPNLSIGAIGQLAEIFLAVRQS